MKPPLERAQESSTVWAGEQPVGQAHGDRATDRQQRVQMNSENAVKTARRPSYFKTSKPSTYLLMGTNATVTGVRTLHNQDAQIRESFCPERDKCVTWKQREECHHVFCGTQSCCAKHGLKFGYPTATEQLGVVNSFVLTLLSKPHR